jgi:hypothetical protein
MYVSWSGCKGSSCYVAAVRVQRSLVHSVALKACTLVRMSVCVMQAAAALTVTVGSCFPCCLRRLWVCTVLLRRRSLVITSLFALFLAVLHVVLTCIPFLGAAALQVPGEDLTPYRAASRDIRAVLSRCASSLLLAASVLATR